MPKTLYCLRALGERPFFGTSQQGTSFLVPHHLLISFRIRVRWPPIFRWPFFAIWIVFFAYRRSGRLYAFWTGERHSQFIQHVSRGAVLFKRFCDAYKPAKQFDAHCSTVCIYSPNSCPLITLPLIALPFQMLSQYFRPQTLQTSTGCWIKIKLPGKYRKCCLFPKSSWNKPRCKLRMPCIPR